MGDIVDFRFVLYFECSFVIFEKVFIKMEYLKNKEKYCYFHFHFIYLYFLKRKKDKLIISFKTNINFNLFFISN
jgi:hypothetical protein